MNAHCPRCNQHVLAPGECCGHFFEYVGGTLTIEPVQAEHADLHDCDHDCACFWCRVSRRESFPTVKETQTV